MYIVFYVSEFYHYINFGEVISLDRILWIEPWRIVSIQKFVVDIINKFLSRSTYEHLYSSRIYCGYHS